MQKWFPVLAMFLLIAPYYMMQTGNPFFVVDLLLAILFAMTLQEVRRFGVHVLLLGFSLVLCWMHPESFLLAPALFAASFSRYMPLPGGGFVATSLGASLYYYDELQVYGLLLLFLLAFLLRAGMERMQKGRAQYYTLYNDMQEIRLRLEAALRQNAEKKEHEVALALLTERNRLTRDMHDGLGHTLSRSILQIGALEATSEPPIRGQLTAVRTGLEEGMTELQANLYNLKEENFDLKAETEKLLRDFTFCAVSLTYTIETPLRLEASYSLLAILKEALHNIVRHSDASYVQIRCLETKDRLFLIITDNGSKADISSYGLGLGSITERAQSFGGQAEFNTESGFSVRVGIPKEGIHAANRHR